MTTIAHVNTRLIAADIAERLGIWSPDGRRQVWRAVEQYGADAVWQLAQDAIDLARTQVDAPRRQIFFDLLQQYRQR